MSFSGTSRRRERPAIDASRSLETRGSTAGRGPAVRPPQARRTTMASLHDSHELLAETQQALSELASSRRRRSRTIAGGRNGQPNERPCREGQGQPGPSGTDSAGPRTRCVHTEHPADRAMRKAGEEQERKDAELRKQRAAALEALQMLDRPLPLPKGPRYVAARLTQNEGDAALDRPPPRGRQDAEPEAAGASGQPCRQGVRGTRTMRSAAGRRAGQGAGGEGRGKGTARGAQATSGSAAGIAHPAALPVGLAVEHEARFA